VYTFFRNFFLFDDFSDKEIENFCGLIHEIKIPPQEILLTQGKIGDNIYFLKEGILEVYIRGTNGFIHVIEDRYPPSIFGEMEFFDKSPVVATIQAKVECILYVISYDDFHAFLIKHPILYQKFVAIILEKWRNVEQGIHQTIALMLRSNDHLAEFASTVSHDLKSPLQTILGYTQLLERYSIDKDDIEGLRYVNKIKDSISRMENLIKGVYEYSVAIQHIPEGFGSVNIATVIDEVIDHLSPSTDIDIHINGELPVIDANKTQMFQIFQNLLENSIKYLDKPDKTVIIDCEPYPDYWQFSVEDNGSGIKQEDLTRVMKIFQKADPNQKGTGVGLAIVESLVTYHGGKVWIESEYGKRTKIYFTISRSVVQFTKSRK